ncbi:MAG: pilus assembly protein PilP [Gammaproteobacteria bacterium]|nr:pilus assembly protein PilP [Gammaproteobacteria bacterium]
MKKILLIITSLLMLSGCVNDDITDLRIYVKKTKASAKGKVSSIPEFKQSEPYTYTGDEVRDPFKPVVDVEVSSGVYNGPRPDENRLKEPLEDFSLDSLKMVGTLTQKEEDWILIKDPDGLLHRVAIGHYMGKNYGKVVSISEEEVTLVELVTDRREGWVERDASIALSE